METTIFFLPWYPFAWVCAQNLTELRLEFKQRTHLHIFMGYNYHKHASTRYQNGTVHSHSILGRTYVVFNIMSFVGKPLHKILFGPLQSNF